MLRRSSSMVGYQETTVSSPSNNNTTTTTTEGSVVPPVDDAAVVDTTTTTTIPLSSSSDPIISDYNPFEEEEENSINQPTTTFESNPTPPNNNHEHHEPTTNTPPTATTATTDDENNTWACNICFDTASEPVITQCGHLYCWPCLYRWMQSHSTQNLQCPVCKAGITQDKIIPIYGRGSSNQTTLSSNAGGVPSRPRGQYTDSRTTPNPNYNPFHNITSGLFGGGGGGMFHTGGGSGGFTVNSSLGGSQAFLFADAFRFFPFFDTQMGHPNRQQLPSEQEELQGFVRRLAMFLGFLVLFYIMFA